MVSSANEQLKEAAISALIDPGADLVICDEAHLLKNAKTVISSAFNQIRTQRRILLTGTPIQNRLEEFYHMVKCVQPKLFGDFDSFQRDFVKPIRDGTDEDVDRKSAELNRMVEDIMQRKDHSVIQHLLPKKHEYTVFIPFTGVQRALYLVTFIALKEFSFDSFS